MTTNKGLAFFGADDNRQSVTLHRLTLIVNSVIFVIPFSQKFPTQSIKVSDESQPPLVALLEGQTMGTVLLNPDDPTAFALLTISMYTETRDLSVAIGDYANLYTLQLDRITACGPHGTYTAQTALGMLVEANITEFTLYANQTMHITQV